MQRFPTASCLTANPAFAAMSRRYDARAVSFFDPCGMAAIRAKKSQSCSGAKPFIASDILFPRAWMEEVQGWRINTALPAVQAATYQIHGYKSTPNRRWSFGTSRSMEMLNAA
jgi:hypothetical protein